MKQPITFLLFSRKTCQTWALHILQIRWLWMECRFQTQQLFQYFHSMQGTTLLAQITSETQFA